MTTHTDTCRRFIVTGRVQGVWYRASTQDQAQSLGLRGQVRNCPDGRVEVIACGAPEALKALEAWLWDGPAEARVRSVDSSPADDPSHPDFVIA
ncbi:acylphosphatase [Spiribacter sp. 2438]|uniref:acylphosphatase n=1 Tax=Spiribacter sp. 2438 TaxID=2666185 RepID=UPI0012AEE248|nr:acylphosphatase [Spiribacter sp. 2438]QGM21254.1 acylphosphatase [Spiribacter sp. 2438]